MITCDCERILRTPHSHWGQYRRCWHWMTCVMGLAPWECGRCFVCKSPPPSSSPSSLPRKRRNNEVPPAPRHDFCSSRWPVSEFRLFPPRPAPPPPKVTLGNAGGCSAGWECVCGGLACEKEEKERQGGGQRCFQKGDAMASLLRAQGQDGRAPALSLPGRGTHSPRWNSGGGDPCPRLAIAVPS